jgi:methyl-accepting chemotaxis protein
MAKLEKQLEQMPPAQKQMIMSRMGPQLETMKKMASGQGIEVTVQVNAIHVNAGLPQQSTVGIGGVPLGGNFAAPSPTAPAANRNDLAAEDKTAALKDPPSSNDPEAAPDAAAAGECHHTVAEVAENAEKKIGTFGRLASAVRRIGRRNKRLAQSASEVAAASEATADAASAVGTLAGDGGSDCK